MPLVSTGSHTAAMPVKSQKIEQIVSNSTAAPQPAPFILSNRGAPTDVIVVNEILVYPLTGQNNTAAPLNGTIQSKLCSVSAAPDLGKVNGEIPLLAMDSDNAVPAGLRAYEGVAGWATPTTSVSNEMFHWSPYNPGTHGFPYLYGPYGYSSQYSSGISTVEPLTINDGEAFKVYKPQWGLGDSTVFVTVTVQTASGESFTAHATSGYGPDIVTIYNGTGSLVKVLDVHIADQARASLGIHRYETIVSNQFTDVYDSATFMSFDSSKAVPSWVVAGEGYYQRNGIDVMVNPRAIIDIAACVPIPSFVGAATARGGLGLNNGKSLDLTLHSNDSLIFGTLGNLGMYQGLHDIIVTFTTYSEPTAAGGEYSYAY
jgi:hypothetical protein